MKVFTGIDIGGTNINVGLVSEEKKILYETSIPTLPEKGPEDAMDRIVQLLNRVLSNGQQQWDCRGIGVGIPGLLDTVKGCILEVSNLPGWQQYPVVSHLAGALHLPVLLENDANLAALGEYWIGAGQGAENMFMVTLGSGIGGALLAKGKILRLHPAAGEFGHMIIEKSGSICTCGRRGCLETYVSKHGFRRLITEKLNEGMESSLNHVEMDSITPQMIAMHADHGDVLAQHIFAEAGEALGMALSNLINLTGVSCIIVGGGIANAWNLLQKPVMQSLEKNVFQSIFSSVRVLKAALGEKAGFVGAAYLAAGQV